MGYETYRIADLIDEIAMGPFGSNIKVSCFVDSGVPVLNGSNLEGFSLSEKTFRYVTREKADSLNKANAHRGDIVITHRGTLGQIVFIPQDSKYDRYVISQSQFRVRCNDKVLPEYLVYYFHTPTGQHKLLSNASQVGVPALARPSSTFQQIEVVLPELSIQKRVVEIISTIQKKIVNNQEQNDNLLEQASSIYQAWFEDFILSDGSCPPSWKQGTLAGIADITSGKRPPVKSAEKTDNAIIPIVGAASVMGYTTEANHTDKILVTGRVGTHGVVQRFNSPCWASDNTLVITSAFYEYTFQILQRIDYRAMNRGSTQPLITQGDMNKVPILIPDNETLLKFETLVGQLMKQYQVNLLENDKLAELREALLPRLMSGELDVSDLDI